MLVGYARVSTLDQNLDRQIDQLVSAGVDKRNIYMEKMSGKKRERPELNRMIDELQDGDTVVIAELSRVSRSTSDTIEIVEQIRNKGASIKSLSETWLDTTSDNPASTLLLTIFAGLVQFERDLTSARVKDGLAAAKRRGHVGGRPSKKNQHYDAIVAMRKGGMGVSEIAKHVGVSNMTVYRVLRDSEDK